jgi:CubicO group peptidase (beta-lactamase class C family)
MARRTAVVLEGAGIRGADADLVVPWWSFGKTALAATALTLVQDGRLGLDAPVDDRGFTLRQLLQHTSGLPDYGGMAEYQAAVAKGAPPWPPALLLERVEAARLRFAPGTDWGYSNVGYMRVAELVEQASDRSLASALSARLFTPLGLTTPRVAQDSADLSDVQMDGAGRYDPRWVYHGLLVGSLGDAARLLDGVLAGRLFSADLLKEMRTLRPLPQFCDALFTDPAQGLGLMRPAPNVLGHTGGGPGSSVAVYRFEGGAQPRTVAVFVDTESPREAEHRAFALGLARTQRDHR